MADLTDEDFATLDSCFYQWPIIAGVELNNDDLFAHYTSAQVAMKIIRGKDDSERCLWLRNATMMNDFMEVEFGQHLLMQALATDPIGADLVKVCNEIHPDIIHAFGQMDEEFRTIKRDTFLLALAMHRGVEQSRGKLSMWRAYGGNANVCILVKPGPFSTDQTAYDVNISPVSYNPDTFKAGLIHITQTMHEKREALKKIDPVTVKFNLKLGVDNMVLSHKHPGFEEENEWRIIKRRAVWPVVDTTPSQVVDVNGVMQEVFYLPMKNVPDKGIHGAELNEILERIIIGPTENPDLVKRAFIRALADAGVEAPHDKVIECGIPLRR